MGLKSRIVNKVFQITIKAKDKVWHRLDLAREILAMGSARYQQECGKLCNKLTQKTGGVVFGGPFAGMKIPQVGAFCSQPNLLVGCYEAELHEFILKCITSEYTYIINIGSAEGYYTVGLARAITNAMVVAYDTDTTCWDVCLQTAKLNQVEGRIVQRGNCTLEELQSAVKSNALIICDCEGGEYDLLNPQEIKALSTCTIICELHDFYNEEITPTLIARFSKTHEIKIVNQVHRNSDDYPILDTLTVREKWLALHENRFVGNAQTLGRYMLFTPNHKLC